MPLLLAGVVLCGVIAEAIAQSKGLSRWQWFLAGLVLGPIGVVWVALTPMSPQKEAERQKAVEDARRRLDQA